MSAPSTLKVLPTNISTKHTSSSHWKKRSCVEIYLVQIKKKLILKTHSQLDYWNLERHASFTAHGNCTVYFVWLVYLYMKIHDLINFFFLIYFLVLVLIKSCSMILEYVLVVSAYLFFIDICDLITSPNMVRALMHLELILNAVIFPRFGQSSILKWIKIDKVLFNDTRTCTCECL